MIKREGAQAPSLSRKIIKEGKEGIMKKNGVWEVVLRIFIAAATAALTALGTTSCMGIMS